MTDCKNCTHALILNDKKNGETLFCNKNLKVPDRQKDDTGLGYVWLKNKCIGFGEKIKNVISKIKKTGRK